MTDPSFRYSERVEQLLGELRLERLSSASLEDVARLHYRLLPWSFNGQFGEKHIIDLYKALAHSPYFFGYLYYREGRLVGFATATTDYRETRNHIMAVYRKRLARMLWVFIRQPSFLLAALESKFLVPRVFRRYDTNAEWLTFVTDTSTGSIGPLVAMRLINVVRDHFRSVGATCYMAQGFKDNPPAMKMYEKLHWRVVATLPMHNIYCYPTEISANAET